MSTISAPLQELLGRLQTIETHEHTGQEPLIQVHQITKRAGVLYEKLRYLVDYKEEHTIRRSAIERILKRKLSFESTQDIALSLLHELVTAGYFPEQAVSQKVTAEVQRIIDGYLALRSESTNPKHGRAYVSFAASEINAFLFPSGLDEAIVEAFYATVRPVLRFRDAKPDDSADLQIYIACHRSLLRSDQSTLAYALWRRLGDVDAVRTAAEHPLGWQLITPLKNHALYFSLLTEIVAQYGVQAGHILGDEERLDAHVTEILNRNYKEIHQRMRQNSIRAVIYIFITKIILALILELPYDVWMVGAIDYLALGINIVFHPLLLFGITSSIPKLTSTNTQRALIGLRGIVSGENVQPVIVRKSGGRGIMNVFFFGMYTVLCVVIFGALYYLLHALHFNIVSMLLFLFFLSLVSYFGLRIRYLAKAWKVETSDQKLFSLVIDLLALPVVRVGRWLSIRFSTVNVFVLMLDFIIETPFQLLLKLSDSFISFLKEKKEEISL